MTWETTASEELLRLEWMKLVAEYIGQRQVTVSQWVDLLPLLKICVRGTGYKRGGGVNFVVEVEDDQGDFLEHLGGGRTGGGGGVGGGQDSRRGSEQQQRGGLKYWTM